MTTRVEIIDDLYQTMRSQMPFSRRQAQGAVEVILFEMVNALSKHKEITLRGFGTFSVSHKKERMAQNPKNGDPAVVSARNVVKFKAGKQFKEACNGNSDNLNP